YGPVRALQGVSLRADDGALMAILGRNGAGKSTVLKAVVGLVRPSRGRVRFAGRDVTSLSAERRVRLGIALCPEGRRVFPDFTVAQNLEVGGHLLGRQDLGGRVEAALELFPALRSRAKQPAGSLSGGEQQMLAIGRALMTEPRLLLLDEPSLGLAPVLTHQVFETVARVRSEGTTVVIVEQNRIALRYADYAYVLNNGTIDLEGPAAEVQDNEQLRRAYLG
ncbi:MAG: ABC transporter ATP-binding protein, partial [Acidimicrobiales bacterium]